MSAIKILIVEDNLLTIENLKEGLNGDKFQVVNAHRTAEAALLEFRADQPDIILVDIHLAGKMDGIAFAERVRELYNIPLIFLSENKSQDYIEKACKIQPEAYLLKPFDIDQVIISIETALSTFGHQNSHDSFFLNDRVFLRGANGYDAVKPENIVYLESDGSYTVVHFQNGPFKRIVGNLKDISHALSTRDFIRVHRSFVINFAFVEEVQEAHVSVNGKSLPIGRTYKPLLNNRMEILR